MKVMAFENNKSDCLNLTGNVAEKFKLFEEVLIFSDRTNRETKKKMSLYCPSLSSEVVLVMLLMDNTINIINTSIYNQW